MEWVWFQGRPQVGGVESTLRSVDSVINNDDLIIASKIFSCMFEKDVQNSYFSKIRLIPLLKFRVEIVKTKSCHTTPFSYAL